MTLKDDNHTSGLTETNANDHESSSAKVYATLCSAEATQTAAAEVGLENAASTLRPEAAALNEEAAAADETVALLHSARAVPTSASPSSSPESKGAHRCNTITAGHNRHGDRSGAGAGEAQAAATIEGRVCSHGRHGG